MTRPMSKKKPYTAFTMYLIQTMSMLLMSDWTCTEVVETPKFLNSTALQGHVKVGVKDNKMSD